LRIAKGWILAEQYEGDLPVLPANLASIREWQWLITLIKSKAVFTGAFFFRVCDVVVVALFQIALGRSSKIFRQREVPWGHRP
jgi:hypothetical protein